MTCAHSISRFHLLLRITTKHPSKVINRSQASVCNGNVFLEVRKAFYKI